MAFELSKDQIEAFGEEGYLILPAVFDAGEVRQMRQEADFILELIVNSSICNGRKSGRLDIRKVPPTGHQIVRKIQPINDLSLYLAQVSADGIEIELLDLEEIEQHFEGELGARHCRHVEDVELVGGNLLEDQQEVRASGFGNRQVTDFFGIDDPALTLKTDHSAIPQGVDQVQDIQRHAVGALQEDLGEWIRDCSCGGQDRLHHGADLVLAERVHLYFHQPFLGPDFLEQAPELGEASFRPVGRDDEHR